MPPSPNRRDRFINVTASLIVGGSAAALVAIADGPTWAWVATWVIVYQIVLRQNPTHA